MEKTLTIQSGRSELNFDSIDTDGDMKVKLEGHGNGSTMYITETDARSIIKHLKEQFGIATV